MQSSSSLKSGARALLLLSLGLLLPVSFDTSRTSAVFAADNKTTAAADSDTAGGDTSVGRRRKKFKQAFGSGDSTDAGQSAPGVKPGKFGPPEGDGGPGGPGDDNGFGPSGGGPGGPGMAPGGPGGRRGMGRMPGGRMAGMGGMGGLGRTPLDLSQLNLTEDQKAKIKSMRVEVQGKAKQAQQNLKARKQELRDLFFDPVATEKQIRAKHAEVRQAQEQAEGLMVDDFIAIRQVLTAEQKKQLPMLKPGMRGRGPVTAGGPGGPNQQGVRPQE